MSSPIGALKIVRSFPHRAAWLARISGLVALLSVPIKHLPERIESFLPIDPDRLSNIVAIIVGLLLFYIGGQLAKRKQRAYYIAILSLTVLIGTESLYFRSPPLLALYFVTLVILLPHKKDFTVRSDQASLRQGLLLAGALIGAALLFGLVAFSFIDQRDFGREYTTGQSLNFTARWLVGLPNPTLTPLTRQDVGIIDSLRIAGITAVLLALASLFRPIRFRFKPNSHDVNRAAALLETYSDSCEDFFKIWPADKHFFFHGDSFIAYTVKQGVALVLDGPTGSAVQIPTLMKNFMEFCEQNDWMVAVIHAGDQYDQLLGRELSMNRLFIGNEAFVDINSFKRDNERNKHFRYVRNKAAKEGLSVQFWPPPLTTSQLATLRHISDTWLTHGNRREYTFTMGYFDDSYLAQCHQAVLMQHDKPVAYVNFIPTYRNSVASIDHMRYTPGVSSVSMHFLLLESILHLHARGRKTLNLGLSPLSGIEKRDDATLYEKALKVVKWLGSRYYSFGGLEQFKSKFSPEWQARYIYYQGGPQQLMRTVAALNQATTYVTPRRRHRLPVLVALLAGLAYASFPLAIWLNAPYAFHGLVSVLGEAGQPNAGIFNILDVVSGLLFVGLTAYLLVRHRPFTKHWRWAIAWFGISAVGAIIAAVVSLPVGFVFNGNLVEALRTINMSIALHGVASFVNTGGFIVSTLLWLRIEHAGSRRDIRRLLLGWSIIAFVTLGPILSYLVPSTGGAIQRLFIALFAIWAVVFVHDALHRSGK
ncbi:MAG TPA: phosphatidylglycerol lysyltransferase domain-containing protein [Patescibacteria group bacterium]|nr:phosphatidylglycerol lysyltransferase domain-containing protein [Patescibacteria group bacterium]